MALLGTATGSGLSTDETPSNFGAMRASLLALTCSRLLYADEWFLAVVCVQIPCTRAKCCDSPRSVDWTWACTCARPATGCRPQPRATSWSTSTVNINQFDSAGRSCSCHSHSNLLSSCLFSPAVAVAIWRPSTEQSAPWCTCPISSSGRRWAAT